MLVLTRWIKNHNLELQFWGYEIGNVLAAISGVGGFLAVYNSFHSVESGASLSDGGFISIVVIMVNGFIDIFQQQPDLAVTVCIGFIVLVSPLLGKGVEKIDSRFITEAYDYTVVLLAILVLAFALQTDTSWITVSGSSFVVASALLRYGLRNPLFLKFGGLFLQTGGIALGMFGIALALDSVDWLDIILSCLTVATGYYVCSAGMLTYIGGIYLSDDYGKDEPAHQVEDAGSSYVRFFHPNSGVVSKTIAQIFDFPFLFLCRFIVNPSIFWLSEQTKSTKPFLTSMAARLPWRFLTGAAALATVTDAGVAFALANFFWVIGDLAIGSIDWDVDPADENVLAVERVLSSGSAVLLLPGSIYADGSKSVVVSKLTFNQFDVGEFLDAHNGETSIFFLDRNSDTELTFRDELGAHLFGSVIR